MSRLVLASSSPYRRALLERLCVPFESLAPDIDESRWPGEEVRDYVERLAQEKARAVAAQRPQALVVGSDQAALHDRAVVGKPADHDEAVRQLLDASGRKVTLHTGLALYNARTGGMQSDVVTYRVYFRQLDRDTVERYLEKEKPYGCAGSLRAEGLGIALLSRFEGDDPNALIGLPLIRLVDMLRAEGLVIP